MTKNPLFENAKNLTLKIREFESNFTSERGYKNREKWRRGMSRCIRCKSKLMFILWQGYSLQKIEQVLHEKHPEIKDIRKYTKNVIREVTGWGIFDDYVYLHKLYPLRKPILAPPEIHELLKERWFMLRVAGESILRDDRKVRKALSKNNETSDLLRAALERVHIHVPKEEGGI